MIENFLIENINQLTIGAFAIAFLVLTWNYFTNKERERESYLKQILAESQKNTEKFSEVINHSQTKMTNALDKLANSIESEKEVFKEVLRELIRNQK
mgnify:CR=1 FL=1